MGNTNLHAARAAKNDEFYTQLCDIEREMTAYWLHNKDVFKGKTILLPCDDPERSNFTRFFASNFERYGIKKLISTSYAQAGRGRKFVLERGEGQIDLDELQWEYLEGDGDFRSEEVTALRDEADIVITNAPFSLMRDFIAWVVEGEVLFSTIANSNAVTYKEIFPLIKDNLMWKGATANSTDLVFEVPAHVEVKQADMDKAKRLGYPSENGRKFTRLGNACWFTNIPHGRRYEKLQLMTMADNLMYSRRKKIREQGYPMYDNYDAIEVAFTEAIPSDWGGIAGVPVSFLDKYNPEQFEIVGTTNSNEEDNPYRTRWYSADEKRQAYEDRFGRKGSYDLNAAGVVNGVKVYGRVLIRHIENEYDGVMGVPVSFLDKYNPEQFEIIGRGGDMEWAENECEFFTPPSKEQQQKHRSADKTWRVQNPYVLNDDGSAQTIYQRIFIRHRKTAVPREAD